MEGAREYFTGPFQEGSGAKDRAEIQFFTAAFLNPLKNQNSHSLDTFRTRYAQKIRACPFNSNHSKFSKRCRLTGTFFSERSACNQITYGAVQSFRDLKKGQVSRVDDATLYVLIML